MTFHGLRPEPMLESQLQAARLEILFPVLVELGVECCDDLEFVQEQDIQKRDDITAVHKRRFFEWKATLFEERSTDASSGSKSPLAAGAAVVSEGRCRTAGYRHESEGPQPVVAEITPVQSPTAALIDRPPPAASSLPMQTPRTRVLPLVQCLRELEILDAGLQEERVRCANLSEELQDERERSTRIAEELQEARKSSNSIADQVHQKLHASIAEELQEERKQRKMLAEELQEERRRNKSITEDLREENKQSTLNPIAEKIIAQELQDERKLSKNIAEELESVRKLAEKLQAQLHVQEKSITEEPERVHSQGLFEQLQEEQERSKRIAEEKQTFEENHSRDIAMLEEMLGHVSAENALLRARINAQGAMQPEVGQDSIDGRNSILSDEPEMEPRKTVADRLSDLSLAH